MSKSATRFQKWSKLCATWRDDQEARDVRIDRTWGQKRTPLNPSEEFRKAFDKLHAANCLLRQKLDELAVEFEWGGLVLRAGELQMQWAHLSQTLSPKPSYADYLTARRVADQLDAVGAALSDPVAAVLVALSALNELREKYGECKPEDSRPEVEQQTDTLCALCEQIQLADGCLDYLVYEIVAFDIYYERYANEYEDER